MMLSFFIDESGQFENPNDNYQIIGGLICKHKNMDDLNRLNNQIIEEFKNIYGPSYIYQLHGKDRDFIKRDQFLKKIFSQSNHYNELMPFFITKGHLSKIINSNITDDNMGSMLFFNMLNTVVSNLILYHPNLLNGERDINLFVASRVAVNVPKEKQVLIESKTGNRGDTIHILNHDTGILVHLNHELNSFAKLFEETFKNNSGQYLKIQIQKEKILYNENNHNEENSLTKYREMFYMSDMICNYVYNSFKNKYNIEFPIKFKFIYDDINELYKKIYRSYLQKDLFEFLSLKEDFNIKFEQNSFFKTYKNYIQLLNIDSIVNENSLKQCLYRVEDMIVNRQESIRKQESILEFIGKYLEQLNDKEKFLYYDLSIRVSNHKGAFVQSKNYFENALELANQISSFETIDQKRRILNRYAVTCSNLFDFNKALEISEQLISTQKNLQENLALLDIDVFGTGIQPNYDTNLGIYYSSKGQYQAFLNMEEAYDSFHEAIKLFKHDQKNKMQTISYLIHYLAESKKSLNSLDKQLIDEYFNGSDLTTQINYLLNQPFLNSKVIQYHIYVFLKYYFYRLNNQVQIELLIKLAQKCLKSIQIKEHPCEFIFYYLAKIVKTKDQKLSRKLYMAAKSVYENSTNDITVQLIGYMIEIDYWKNKEAVENFINFVKSLSNYSSLLDYFEINKLIEMDNLSEKINNILSKFTFMYH